MNYYYKYLKYKNKYLQLKADKIEFIKGRKLKYGIVLIRNLFNENECAIIKKAYKLNGSQEVKDRDEDLKYNHIVWRIEKTQSEWPKIYKKALNSMKRVDKLYWNALKKYKNVYPEVEYILYKVKKGSKLPSIEPHVDNDSVITMITMLSKRNDYVGGESYFEGTDDIPRMLSLNLGDTIFFRGELTEHWISPVKEGIRSILQIELSKDNHNVY